MAKIFSILTLLAAALALYLGLESGKRVKELQASGERIGKKLTFTEGELTKTKDNLKTSEESLAVTKGSLEKSNGELATAKDDLGKAKTELAAKSDELEKANANLDTVKKAIEEAFPGEGLQGVANLKTKITDLTDKMKAETAKVGELTKKVADLEGAVVAAEEGVKQKDAELASRERVIKRYTENIMQKGVRGRVMAVNAGWGFAVLSVGDRGGAAANKVMIVTRGGQAIGKVRITNVEATQSVADILPGTFVRGTYVEPGDQVIYTGDDKVKPEEVKVEDVKIHETVVPGAPAPSTPAAPQPALPQ